MNKLIKTLSYYLIFSHIAFSIDVDYLANEVNSGKNINIFNKKIYVSNQKEWIQIKKKDIKNPDKFFSKILKYALSTDNKNLKIYLGMMMVRVNSEFNIPRKKEELFNYHMGLLEIEDETVLKYGMKIMQSKKFNRFLKNNKQAHKAILKIMRRSIGSISYFGNSIDSSYKNTMFILAKTGTSREAIKLLDEYIMKIPSQSIQLHAAKAIMGDQPSQNWLLSNFKNSKDHDKAKYAFGLSYWGSEEAMRELAKALRDEGVAHIIYKNQSLHHAISYAFFRGLKNKGILLFTGKHRTLWEEKEFDIIENYARVNYRVDWNKPRPQKRARQAISYTHHHHNSYQPEEPKTLKGKIKLMIFEKGLSSDDVSKLRIKDRKTKSRKDKYYSDEDFYEILKSVEPKRKLVPYMKKHHHHH